MKKTEKSNTNEIMEIPAEEAPYALPDGWKWVRLVGGFAECMDNCRKPVNADERESRKGDIPYYGATGQVGWINDYLTDEELVLLGEDGAPFFDLMRDKAYIIKGKAWVNNHAHILKALQGHTSNLFLLYYLNSFNFKGYVNGTTRLKLTQSSMGLIPVPLPPLETQKRIVDRIESLFAKLDEAKEKAQTALDTFELRKSAILHKAFTGELTAKWRSLNSTSNISNESVLLESTLADISSSTTTGHSENVLGDLPFPWEIKPLSSVCKSIFDGDHQPPPKSENGVPFIFISNVNKGILLFDECSYVSQEYYDNLKDTRKPEYGDVLYTLVGSYGIPVVVDKTQAFCFQRHMALLKPKNIDTYFLWYQLQTSRVFNEATKIATGTAQLTVPIKGLRELQIIVPPLPEQQEIVRILDDLLAKENAAKEAAEAVIEKIDLMKKSILARAFRGEL